MFDNADRFFGRRARQHRLSASGSTCPEVRRCHDRLAVTYGAVAGYLARLRDSAGTG